MHDAKKRTRIRKKVCRGRVRAFNLPIRSLGRYPYTTGSEGICGRILLTTLGLETQKCSETVFTTSKQRTVPCYIGQIYGGDFAKI